jgi:stage V sporulation protein D (sporulation-specific penicillin-binding protein)
MKAVVTDGGANNAYVAGFDVGGKTGTSEKINEMQATGEKLYIASFLGVAPIDDPELAVLVLIDEPHGNSHYGGTVAAPVAAEIFKDILPYLGYEPQYTEEELKSFAVKVPNLDGKTVLDAKTELQSLGLTYTVVGEGESVLKQLPEAGESLNKGGNVILYTEETEGMATVTVVPNFIGMTYEEAKNAATQAGVNLKNSGVISSQSAVRVYDQNIQSGSEVAIGTTVTIHFRDESAVY